MNTEKLKVVQKTSLKKFKRCNETQGDQNVKLNPVEAQMTQSNESDNFMPTVREKNVPTEPT